VKGTYRKSALASPKPSASANTASLDAAPKSLSANIARYRSNKGDFVFKSAVLKSGIDCGRDEGAGSIVGKSGLVVSSTFILCRAPCSPFLVCAKTSGSCTSTAVTEYCKVSYDDQLKTGWLSTRLPIPYRPPSSQ